MSETPRRLAAAIVFCLAMAPLAASADALAAPEPDPASGGLAIADFTYSDTSREARDQEADHRRRMLSFMRALRRDLSGAVPARLVPLACGSGPCSADSADLVSQAGKAGADLLLAGGIHKVSTLVQWAKVTLADLRTGHALLDRSFSFRGDDDMAWDRAAGFIARDIVAALPDRPASASIPASVAPPAPEVASRPVRLAVFTFELDDFGPGAALARQNPAESGQIEAATDAAREQLARSGRYVLLDGTNASAEAARTHTLRDCNGCDAAIARDLGAEQSLVGVIRRISQTEYVVRISIRDARTGAVLADAQSGLRSGASYSWNRGVTRLIEDRLLAPGARR